MLGAYDKSNEELSQHMDSFLRKIKNRDYLVQDFRTKELLNLGLENTQHLLKMRDEQALVIVITKSSQKCRANHSSTLYSPHLNAYAKQNFQQVEKLASTIVPVVKNVTEVPQNP